MNTHHTGTLYVVATPIGNLEDITFRAVRILREVELIAAEDTRHSKKLLNHYAIRTPMVSYHRHSEKQRATQLLQQLAAGNSIALISDAGTPGIADPGDLLIDQARAQGITVEAIPGPSALTTALSLSGRGDHPFCFLGFLPSKEKERAAVLTAHKNNPANLIFYEAPHRLLLCLSHCRELLGNRQAIWFRELTKIHEEITTGPLSVLIDHAEKKQSIKGESVVLLSGSATQTPLTEDPAELLTWHRTQNHSLKDAVQEVAALLDLPRSRVYKQALAIWTTEK